MSRRADREGVPRARYCLDDGNPRALRLYRIGQAIGPP
jgi:hypothetical protein